MIDDNDDDFTVDTSDDDVAVESVVPSAATGFVGLAGGTPAADAYPAIMAAFSQATHPSDQPMVRAMMGKLDVLVKTEASQAGIAHFSKLMTAAQQLAAQGKYQESLGILTGLGNNANATPQMLTLVNTFGSKVVEKADSQRKAEGIEKLLGNNIPPLMQSLRDDYKAGRIDGKTFWAHVKDTVPVSYADDKVRTFYDHTGQPISSHTPPSVMNAKSLSGGNGEGAYQAAALLKEPNLDGLLSEYTNTERGSREQAVAWARLAPIMDMSRLLKQPLFSGEDRIAAIEAKIPIDVPPAVALSAASPEKQELFTKRFRELVGLKAYSAAMGRTAAEDAGKIGEDANKFVGREFPYPQPSTGDSKGSVITSDKFVSVPKGMTSDTMALGPTILGFANSVRERADKIPWYYPKTGDKESLASAARIAAAKGSGVYQHLFGSNVDVKFVQDTVPLAAAQLLRFMGEKGTTTENDFLRGVVAFGTSPRARSVLDMQLNTIIDMTHSRMKGLGLTPPREDQIPGFGLKGPGQAGGPPAEPKGATKADDNPNVMPTPPGGVKPKPLYSETADHDRVVISPEGVPHLLKAGKRIRPNWTFRP